MESKDISINSKRKSENDIDLDLIKQIKTNPSEFKNKNINLTDTQIENIYDVFHQISSKGHKIEEDPNLDENLILMHKYKQSTLQTIVTEEILPNSQQSQFTPLIFTKKPVQFLRNVKQMSGQLMAFENYLNLVTMMYYKKNLNIADLLITPENMKEFVALKPNNNYKSDKEYKQNKNNLNNLDKDKKNKIKTVPEQVNQVVKKTRGRAPKVPKDNDSSISQIDQQTTNFSESIEDQENFKMPNQIQQESSIGSKQQLSKSNLKEENTLPTENLAYTNVLDSLISPIRYEQVYENWTPKEIAIFECAMCKFGRQFSFISQLIQTKSPQDIYQFYIAWKQTSHYKQWKQQKTILNRGNFTTLV